MDFDLMPLITEWQPSDPVQILVYGAAKTGKTAGALTAPRPVVFDFDRGASTARNDWFVSKYGLRWVFYENFIEKKQEKGVVLAHNAFDDACRYFDEWMKPKGKWKDYEVGVNQFDTFVIDSGTTLSEIAMNKAAIILGKMGLSKSHDQAQLHGVLVPKIQDYGSERSLVEQFIDMVRGSGKNVILICHEKEILSDSGALQGVVPLLTGKSAESVPLKFDEVYNLRVKKEGPNVVRYLQTQADGIRKVGSRYGMPDGCIWEWDTVSKTLEKIKNQQRQSTITKGS